MRLQAQNIETDLPSGWEGRINVRPRATLDTRSLGHPDEITNTVLHMGNFALPEDRGDFGSGAVDVMGEDNVLIVLLEYGAPEVGTALFAREGLPTNLTPSMFSASALQRTLPEQAGSQVFFTEAGRPFCCYTVLGRQSAAARVLPEANAALAGTRILPR